MCSKIVVLFTTLLAPTDINSLSIIIVIFTTRPKFLHKTAKPSRFRAITFIVRITAKSCSFHRPVFLLLVRFRQFLTARFLHNFLAHFHIQMM